MLASGKGESVPLKFFVISQHSPCYMHLMFFLVYLPLSIVWNVSEALDLNYRFPRNTSLIHCSGLCKYAPCPLKAISLSTLQDELQKTKGREHISECWKNLIQ